MNQELLKLQPASIWKYFVEILDIPRPSKKEEKIAKYLMDFAAEQKLEAFQDAIGNVIIRKEATKGMENKPWVVLQSHIDMVCEKNSDVEHDFDKDPIQAWIDTDGWVKAKGTTLGADDGIGIAAQMAILAAGDVQHGPIECLFTVDEETGLTGAFELDKNALKSRILLNLDSEDEGELFIGCAGGKDTVAKLPVNWKEQNEDLSAVEISVTGLRGGHSGDDIHKGYGNAVKILNRLLWELDNEFGIRIAKLDAGNLRNAIAREGFATILSKQENIENILLYIYRYNETLKNEYKVTEQGLEISVEKTIYSGKYLSKRSKAKLLGALYACPHGVIAWSQEIENFVETSTNLAAVKTTDDHMLITTSQRSSVESAKRDIGNMVASVFHLIGAKVEQSNGYPGWKPNPKSMIMDLTSSSYKKIFNEEPKVLAIHAGLECGLIGEKFPGMDMISFGPTIKGAHSPDERIEIESVTKFWDLLIDVLKNIPEA